MNNDIYWHITQLYPVKTVLQEICRFYKLNLVSLALKMKLFLQDIKTLQEKITRQFSCKTLIKSYKKVILHFFLQDSCKIVYILQEKLHFSARIARYVQDSVQDLASIARKILVRFAYFLQDGF